MDSSLSLLFRALLAWLSAAAVMLVWARLGSPLGGWLIGLLLASLTSALLSVRLRLPSWWWWINGLVPGFAVLALRSQALPLVWLGLGLGLLLVFGASFQSRVPLWLSSRRARQALLDTLPAITQARFLDLGGGFAGPACAVKRRRPEWRVDACEWAPLPFLIGGLRIRLRRLDVHWWRRDFWQIDFADYQVIYAYLSPAPMSALWQKCLREMRPGSLLISYRFAIDQAEPSRIIELGAADDRLLIYRR